MTAQSFQDRKSHTLGDLGLQKIVQVYIEIITCIAFGKKQIPNFI